MSGAQHSTAWHRRLRAVTRLFGGRYGQLPPAPAPLPEPETIELAEVGLRVLEWPGDGPCLLLLHGLNNNAWSWARVAAQLSPARRVLAVCARGHGGSTAPERGYGLDETSADLRELLDRLGVAELAIAGHSWGGKIAMHLTASLGARVRALVLADPVPPAGLTGVIRTFPAMVSAALGAERGPYPSHAAWQRAGRSVVYLQHDDEVDRRLWQEAIDEHADGSYHHRLPDAAFDEIFAGPIAADIGPLVATIRCPVLLLRPTFTVSFAPGEVRRMRRLLPQLAHQRIAGDHTFILTNPLDTAATMARFLAGAADG